MNVMQTVGEIIFKERTRQDLSLRQLEYKTGVSHSMIDKIEKGLTKKKPSAEILAKLEAGLRLARGRLLEAAGYIQVAPPVVRESEETYHLGPMIRLPIIGDIRCGPTGIIDEVREGRYASVDIELLPFVAADVREWYWLRIKGDSMKDAGYLDGGLALIHKQDTIETGEIGVVMVDCESGTLKRVYWHHDLHVIELRPENDQYEPNLYPINADVRILGKAYGAFNFS